MSRRSQKSPASPPPPPVVEGAWLLKAFAVVIVVAFLCTYATLCTLFYKTQWRLVLHPARTTASAENLIHFFPGISGQPQLTGEWLPATATNSYNRLTVLFLAGGDATRSDFAETQSALRDLGLNVFTFDYRGYGASANIHPSQQQMTEDSEAAWRYLTDSRGVSRSGILPYGVGVGASLALGLATSHPDTPGVILDSPHTDLCDALRNDSRFRFLPVGLLCHEDFPLIKPLSDFKRPKLLITHGQASESGAFGAAADPKIVVSLTRSTGPNFVQTVSRFLDQDVMVSTPAPSGIKLH